MFWNLFEVRNVVQFFVLLKDNTFRSLVCAQQLLRSSKHTTARHMDNTQHLLICDELISDMLCKCADMLRVTTSKHLDDCLGRAAQRFQEPLGIHTYVHDFFTTSSLELNCHDNEVRNLPGLRMLDQHVMLIMILLPRHHNIEQSIRIHNVVCPYCEHSLVIRKCCSCDTFHEGGRVTSAQLTFESFCELFRCIQHTSTI